MGFWKQESPARGEAFSMSPLSDALFGYHAHKATIARTFYVKANPAIQLGENRVIVTQTNVFTWVKAGAALTNNDVTRTYSFTAVTLNTKSF